MLFLFVLFVFCLFCLFFVCFVCFLFVLLLLLVWRNYHEVWLAWHDCWADLSELWMMSTVSLLFSNVYTEHSLWDSRQPDRMNGSFISSLLTKHCITAWIMDEQGCACKYLVTCWMSSSQSSQHAKCSFFLVQTFMTNQTKPKINNKQQATSNKQQATGNNEAKTNQTSQSSTKLTKLTSQALIAIILIFLCMFVLVFEERDERFSWFSEEGCLKKTQGKRERKVICTTSNARDTCCS